MRSPPLAAAVGVVLAAASVAWLLGALSHLDPCGIAGELSSVCEAPPAAVRVGQLGLAATGAAAGVLAGALAVLRARRPVAARLLRPALAVFATLALAWVVLFDAGILIVRG